MKAVILLLALASAASADPDLTVHVEPERETHWQRMLLETAGLFAAGEAYYYRGDGRASAGDWQLPGNWSALGRKLTGDGIRFDSNGFVTNAVKHPILFGATTHILARENGYSLAESFVIASAVSIGWEFVGEWREYASINDLATTSPAGTPVGEAVYQIAHNLRRTHFELHGGLGRVGAVDFRTVGASAEITEGQKVGLAVEVPFDRSARAVDFRARTDLGRHVIAEYDYLQKFDRPDWQWDLLANVRVGPTAQLDRFSHGVALRVGIDATADFAMVKSMAYGKWRAAHPMDVVQGVLDTNTHYYYYAGGLTLAPRIAIEYRGIGAGASLAFSTFSSLDGHDRDQEIETTHIHLHDTDRTAAAWVGARVAGATLQVIAREQQRYGDIGMVEDVATDRSVVLSLGYRN